MGVITRKSCVSNGANISLRLLAHFICYYCLQWNVDLNIIYCLCFHPLLNSLSEQNLQEFLRMR
ncbi:unnamed protein product [Paramecium primaurelia]|uniref:Uncharacterized protein n=1 Tax=Paramecium primaurelia TaxID=5886 RepID=A0A8S1QJP1_PARPR|nr:unnamed protein product [Paramecium primaurelia]